MRFGLPEGVAQSVMSCCVFVWVSLVGAWVSTLAVGKNGITCGRNRLCLPHQHCHYHCLKHPPTLLCGFCPFNPQLTPNQQVSMFDDKVWQVLAELPAPEALAAIQEAADALDNPDVHIRNVNAFFLVRGREGGEGGRGAHSGCSV